MQLSLKRLLDTWLGVPFLCLLNFCALILGKTLRRNHAIDPVHVILVTKFQGMGSLVIAKPSLRWLRIRYPNAKIVLWGTPSIAIVARECPEIDEVLVLNDTNFWSAAVSTIKGTLRLIQLRVDWAFDFEVYSKLSAVLLTLTCARNRAGFAIDSVRMRRGIHTHLLYFNRYGYLGDAYFRLCSLASEVEPSTHSMRADFGGWRTSLTPLAKLPGPYVVLNIHAGDLAPTRKWPRSSFELLAQKLLALHSSLRIILIGYGTVEARETAKFWSNDRITNLAGTLDFRETLRCLAHARLVVSNDSAPLHLALSTGVPVLGLFGPTRGETYFPAGLPHAEFVSTQYYCSPCVHHWEPPPCGGINRCMITLEVARVFELCKKLARLELTPSQHQAQVQLSPLEDHNINLPIENYRPGLIYRRPPMPLCAQPRPTLQVEP